MKEKPKEEAAHSTKTSETSEQQSKPGKEKQSQSEVEKVNPQQSEFSKKDQSGNRNRQAREQRDFGDERPRNRNRRRGGRRGAPDGQNERGVSKDIGQKHDNGPQEKGPSRRGPVEKSPLANEEKKATVKEEGEHDVQMNTVSDNKDTTPVAKDVEKHNGVSKSQDAVVVNRKETDTGNNSSEGLNGERSNQRESSTKEALPQRQERGSRRRGGHRDRSPQEKGPSQRGPVEKSPLANEEKKATVKEEGEHDFKMNTVSDNKDTTPVAKDVEKHNGVSKSQDAVVVNGKETDTGNNSSEGLNGEKSNQRESSTKEALPQRQERGSRRRGGHRDRRYGPSSRPTPNRDLNGGKPVENGVGHSHTEEESGVQMSEDGSQNKEHDKGLDKVDVPIVNGYIPVKELNEGSIGR